MFQLWQRKRPLLWAPDQDGVVRDVTNTIIDCLPSEYAINVWMRMRYPS